MANGLPTEERVSFGAAFRFVTLAGRRLQARGDSLAVAAVSGLLARTARR
ncbi:MAG: hypothetical protein ACE37K_02955 [Planctomycetota bacterium]